MTSLIDFFEKWRKEEAETWNEMRKQVGTALLNIFSWC